MREQYGLVPHLVIAGAAKAVAFYSAALGAVEVVRMPDLESDRLMYVLLKIGDAPLLLSDDSPEYSGDVPQPGTRTPIILHLDVPNCDEAVARAVAAGATIAIPAKDLFWGDRYAKITDPFGQEWSFSQELQ